MNGISNVAFNVISRQVSSFPTIRRIQFSIADFLSPHSSSYCSFPACDAFRPLFSCAHTECTVVAKIAFAAAFFSWHNFVTSNEHWGRSVRAGSFPPSVSSSLSTSRHLVESNETAKDNVKTKNVYTLSLQLIVSFVRPIWHCLPSEHGSYCVILLWKQTAGEIILDWRVSGRDITPRSA